MAVLLLLVAATQPLETQNSLEMRGPEVVNLDHAHFCCLREEGAAAYAGDPASELSLSHAWMLGHAKSLGKH